MAYFVYNRCSTSDQDFVQQQNCITTYLQSRGIDPNTDIMLSVVEKISGTVNHTERKLANLLRKCGEGDTIFISELSRLGRNMSDLFAIVTECCDKGITIVQCKDGSIIENQSIGGKALLFALSLAAEIEVANTRQRTQMALDARKQILAKGGSFISKSGRVCTKLGRPKITEEEREAGITPNCAGPEAAAQKRTDNKIRWKEQSAAYRWTMDRVAENMPRKEIVRLFNEQHKYDPAFSTRSGKPLTEAILCLWIREANPLVLVG